MAQAGGKNIDELSQALDQVEKIVERMITAGI
jgi:hypothetical protein